MTTENAESRSVGDLVRPKLYRGDGSPIDPWDSLAVSYLLAQGRWHDSTPIDSWQREALRLLLDERSRLDRPVPPPAC